MINPIIAITKEIVLIINTVLNIPDVVLGFKVTSLIITLLDELCIANVENKAAKANKAFKEPYSSGAIILAKKIKTIKLIIA
tara:strand:- start:605 stop:850 length:246 start_codon:yes stop_codon:yes gene_type:complete